eukprot:7403276-Pyramimonas_sp.AAC.2
MLGLRKPASSTTVLTTNHLGCNSSIKRSISQGAKVVEEKPKQSRPISTGNFKIRIKVGPGPTAKPSASGSSGDVKAAALSPRPGATTTDSRPTHPRIGASKLASPGGRVDAARSGRPHPPSKAAEPSSDTESGGGGDRQ